MVDTDRLLKREKWLEKFEILMMGIAAIAVAIYMADLLGIWTTLGLEVFAKRVSFALDLVFVINLIVKISALGRLYLNNPWFVVDLISSLPILASLAALPSSFQALSFVRSFRLFRALRALRMLNVVPILQVNEVAPCVTKEIRAHKYAMWILIPSYSIVFIIIINRLYSHYGTEAPRLEFYLLLGSILGLLLAILVTRYLIPAIMSIQINKLLNIALPSQVARHFMLHPESYNETVMMPASIIFCDIKNFTTTVEAMSNNLSALKQNLELIMTAVTEVHSKYDLIIDKFIGDAIMSFKGGDLVTGTPEENAWSIVKAGLESLKTIRRMGNPYFRDMKVGGASTDSAMIGAFGTPSRLSYTILGDRVNLAARLESAVKQCGTDNLFCDRTYELLQGHPDFVWRRFGRIHVEGKNESLHIYEAFDANEIHDTRWIDHYHDALALFEKRDFAAANEGFLRSSKLREGGDTPSQLYSKICLQMINTPPEKDWTPIFITFK